jgi:hypothetical protein
MHMRFCRGRKRVGFAPLTRSLASGVRVAMNWSSRAGTAAQAPAPAVQGGPRARASAVAATESASGLARLPDRSPLAYGSL